MLNSPIIEVIIGMVFIYSLLSVLVTQINTVIDNIINLRASHLKQGLKDMLSDPTIRARFLTHPLIGVVRRPLNPHRPLSAQGAEKVIESDTSDVTWIDKTIFSEVLLELIFSQTPVDRVQVYAPLLEASDKVLTGAEKAQVRSIVRRLEAGGGGTEDIRFIIDNLRDPEDRRAMLDALDEALRLEREFSSNAGEMLALIRGLRAIPSKDFQRALDTLLLSARDLREVRERLETWFDYNMDRVVQTFRKSMQKITLVVAIVMTLVLNIDTLQMARSLWDDPTLRDTVVVAARTSIETVQQEAAQEVAAAEESRTTAPRALVPPQRIAREEDRVEEAQQRLDQSVQQTRDTLSSLLELRLPLGWGFVPVDVTMIDVTVQEGPLQERRNLWNYWPLNNPDNWVGLLVAKLIGLSLTVLAISQGAPFWFDLLRRVTGTSGQKQQDQVMRQ